MQDAGLTIGSNLRFIVLWTGGAGDRTATIQDKGQTQTGHTKTN